MPEKNSLRSRLDIHNRILWILAVTIVWYMFVFSLIEGYLFDENFLTKIGLYDKLSDAMKFNMMYVATIVPFVGILVYTGVTKRNRFILDTFRWHYKNNSIGMLLKGLLVGFIMNFGCIVWALLNGNIKLYLDFAWPQLPFFIFALVCVFIQSTSEELWCRGFVYERINVRYPLWVAILVNGLFFAALHLFNPGVSFLPIFDIAICGLSFSIAKWYTGSIWFPMGIHTAWNFIQNYLFGLPNSGIVSEASIYHLDAASANTSLIYDMKFGVEGGVPAVLADAVLGIVCIILAARKGRLRELIQRRGNTDR